MYYWAGYRRNHILRCSHRLIQSRTARRFLIRIVATYRAVCPPEQAVQCAVTKGRTYAPGIQSGSNFKGNSTKYPCAITLTKKTDHPRQHYAIGLFDLSWETSAFLMLRLWYGVSEIFFSWNHQVRYFYLPRIIICIIYTIYIIYLLCHWCYHVYLHILIIKPCKLPHKLILRRKETRSF